MRLCVENREKWDKLVLVPFLKRVTADKFVKFLASVPMQKGTNLSFCPAVILGQVAFVPSFGVVMIYNRDTKKHNMKKKRKEEKKKTAKQSDYEFLVE